MRIDEEHKGDVTVLKPHGPLVGVDAEQFQAHFSSAMKESPGRVILDASTIPFVDSRGLETLTDATEQLIRSGLTLKICGVNDDVGEVLELTELAPMFEQFECVEAGVESF